MKLKYIVQANNSGQIFESYVSTLAAAKEEARLLKRTHPAAKITIAQRTAQ